MRRSSRSCRSSALAAVFLGDAFLALAGHRLHGLPLAAIRRSPERPVIEFADGVARIPELRGDAAVAGILQHADFLSAFDLPADFC